MSCYNNLGKHFIPIFIVLTVLVIACTLPASFATNQTVDQNTTPNPDLEIQNNISDVIDNATNDDTITIKNETYAGSGVNNNITIDKSMAMPGGLISPIIVNPPVVIVGQNFIISGTLLNQFGNPIAGANLAVSITNIGVWNVVTNFNGQWSININLLTPLPTGTYYVTVSWANGTYINSTTFTVIPNNTNSTTNTSSTIIVSPTVVVTTQNFIISGRVVDQFGVAVAGANLAVTIGGTVSNVVTNGTGHWSIVKRIDIAGTYTATVTWTGNNAYNGFTNSITFTVIKANTSSTIVTNATVVVTTQNITISGRVVDQFGVAVANANLAITITNSPVYNVVTNATGHWSIGQKIERSASIQTIQRIDRVGTYNVAVSWVGNDTYNGFTNSTNFTAIKANTSSIITGVATTGSFTISGRVVDQFGNAIAGAKLAVNTDNGVYNVATNANGDWSISQRIDNAGTYKVAVSWEGNDIYNGFFSSTTFTVINPDSTIIGKATDIVATRNIIINDRMIDEFSSPVDDLKLLPNVIRQ